MNRIKSLCVSTFLCVIISSPVWAQPYSRASLGEIPVPGPDNLNAFEGHLSSKIDGSSVPYTAFVIDEEALIDLGKALFWDMQLGSDGVQACASCHFSAGADPRTKNQLNPGLNGGDENFGLGGPNYQLKAGDFPFHKLSNENDRKSNVISSVNEVASSQGVEGKNFVDISLGDAEEIVSDIHRDMPFSMKGRMDTRRVEPRNTPTVFNAVFNFRNFWDGRASNNFNGVSIFGNRDKHARVVSDEGGGASTVKISIPLSSSASQAVGPLTSDFEMSATGRIIPKIGKKILAPGIVPLGKQVVHQNDSRLGYLSNDNGSASIPGLNTTYAAMIEAAINPRWWDSDAVVKFSTASNGTPVPSIARTGVPVGTDEYTVMEANFPLIFGLAVQAYEQELITDQTPFDRFVKGNSSAMTTSQKRGLEIFESKGKCANCHEGPTFSGATVNAIGSDDTDSESSFTIIEQMDSAANMGLASMVFFTGDIPTLDPDDRQLRPLRMDPHGLTFEIRARGSNELLFSGVFPATTASNNGSSRSCSAHSEHLEFTPVSAAIDSLSTKARAEFKTFSNCAEVFKIKIEHGFASLPAGQYELRANKRSWGIFRIEPHNLYDSGFYNIGVRPIDDDLGAGGKDPFGNPLSFTEMELLKPGRWDIREGLPSSNGFNPSDPIGSHNERPVMDGAFKVPLLRNLKLSAPYFHNGGKRTIEEVVRFYNRGGDFSDDNLFHLAPDITVLDLSETEIGYLVDFLENALLDQRVVNQQAPFDHPQLFVPEGHSEVDGITILAEARVVGASGGVAAATFQEELTPTGFASHERDALDLSTYNDDSAAYGDDGTLPHTFSLEQNYPNPFNPNTTINFSLAKSIQVNLDIYNMLGQRVKTLVNGQLDAGIHSVNWDGTNDAGELLASGVYLYKLNTPNFEYTRKMSFSK